MPHGLLHQAIGKMTEVPLQADWWVAHAAVCSQQKKLLAPSLEDVAKWQNTLMNDIASISIPRLAKADGHAAAKISFKDSNTSMVCFLLVGVSENLRSGRGRMEGLKELYTKNRTSR
jgi:hypothetical protein